MTRSALFCSLRTLECLEHLEITSCQVGGCREFTELSKILRQKPHLETVVLENCGITDGDTAALVELFQIPNLKRYVCVVILSLYFRLSVPDRLTDQSVEIRKNRIQSSLAN